MTARPVVNVFLHAKFYQPRVEGPTPGARSASPHVPFRASMFRPEFLVQGWVTHVGQPPPAVFSGLFLCAIQP